MNKVNTKPKICFVVNVDWFFLSHRLPIAKEALENGYEVHVAVGITEHLKELMNYGFIVHPIEFNRGSLSIFSNIKNLFEILIIFKKISPDLVHLISIKPLLLGGIAARIMQIPSLVISVSGLGYIFVSKGLIAKIRRFFIKLIYRIALKHKNSRIIFQNKDDLLEILQISGIKKEDTILIKGSGVSLDKFNYQPIPSGQPIVLMASRLLKDKGVFEFYKAAKIVRSKLSDSKLLPRFILVGSIDNQNHASISKIENKKLKIDPDIELWGERHDMENILPIASIIALPSYREGLPKVLCEAAACGRAVVTSNVPGCRDAIINNITGLLCNPMDEIDLSNKIIKLLLKKDMSIEMGKSGRKFAEKEFNILSIVAKHMNIYEDLIENFLITNSKS